MIVDDSPDVHQILELLAEGVTDILDQSLVGLYLMGSLTYGDFDRGSSDIDFFAVMTKELTDEELDKLTTLHKGIGLRFPEWVKRIEGSYVPIGMLQSKTPPKETRLYVNAGKFWHLPFGDEWLLNLFQIQEYGVVLTGKSIHDVFPRVLVDEVKQASRRNLLSDWKPKLSEPDPFTLKDYDSSHLQAYAVLSMCRILYTHKQGKVASKKVAADWAKDEYGQWLVLITSAEQWKHGMKLDLQQEILEFIKFVLSVVA